MTHPLDLQPGTPERLGGKPRTNAADALATMLEMSTDEWIRFCSSPGVPMGLTPAEQEGYAAALGQRLGARRVGERSAEHGYEVFDT
jgi:hypothetical protein